MNSLSTISYLVPFLNKTLLRSLISFNLRSNKIIISISNDLLRSVLNFLAKSSIIKANSLLDIWVVDYPERENRFEVNYLLVSVKHEIRYIVKTLVSEYKYIYSVTNLFPSANWLEREVWDMYGVLFIEHIDLRRILTDYGFSGHPLRKDFPLTGYTELRYDDSEKRVVVEVLEASQEFRLFNYSSPWENKD